MVTISGVEVTPVRTSQRYFLSVHIRGGASSLSAQQDERKMSVDTSQTFFAKYLGPHVKTGETIFVSLNLPFAAKFVSFQSELTSMGKSLSINEVRFLQGTIPSSLYSLYCRGKFQALSWDLVETNKNQNFLINIFWQKLYFKSLHSNLFVPQAASPVLRLLTWAPTSGWRATSTTGGPPAPSTSPPSVWTVGLAGCSTPRPGPAPPPTPATSGGGETRLCTGNITQPTGCLPV